MFFLDPIRLLISGAHGIAAAARGPQPILSPRTRLAALQDKIAFEKARGELYTMQAKNDAIFRGRHPQ
uniref:Uncharacterized protein n=1 Tax=Panagrolaimus sp. ES5 TaxID=591445 RepID=A0AC34GWS5_9BILA